MSVVIPSYQYGRYVTDAVDSALGQTWAPLEVIVIDDGSTDDTRERLSAYGQRIRYVHQENRGLSAARNRGIREARGEWIAFLDADDRWHPQKLEVQFRAVANAPDIRFLGSPATQDLARALPAAPEVRRLTVRDFLGQAPLGPSSAVVHESCFRAIGGFDETLTSAEDRDMWLRLVARFPAALVEARCWWYRQHPLQMSRNPAKMRENYVRVLKQFLRDQPQPWRVERFGWGFLSMDSCYSHFEAGNRITALGFLLRSVWLYPGRLSRNSTSRLVRLKVLIHLLLGRKLWSILRSRLGLGSSDAT